MASDTRREPRVRRAGGESVDPKPAKANPRRSWRWPVALALLAALVWLLPSIIAYTPLLNLAIKTAAADLKGSVAVRSASLGWLSPVVVEGVELKDADGKAVLTLPAARTERSLAGILLNYTRLGVIRVQSPKLALVLRDDGSNLEDMLEKYMTPKPSSSPTKIGLSIDIADGAVAVTDAHTGQTWQLQKLDVRVDMPDGPDGPIEAKLTTDLHDAARRGKLSLKGKLAGAAGEATLSADQLPLAMFRALAARFAPGTTLTGRVSSEAAAAWGGAGGQNRVQFNLSADGLALATPTLKDDALQLERFRAGAVVSWKADQISVENAAIECDVGSLALGSTLKLDPKEGFSWNTLLRQRHELNGRVDLARLARLLPGTLRLRKDLQITSGEVKLAATARLERQSMAWHGQLDASRIAAVRGNQPIAWERPVSLVLDARENADRSLVGSLNCESDFLKIHAEGAADALAGSFSFSLKQLAAQLGQFVDFGKSEFVGEGWGNLNWRRAQKPQFDADAEVHLRNCEWSLPGQPPWREDDLVATLSAKGQTDFGDQTQIDAATVTLKSAADQLDVRLTEPVKSLSAGAWPVRARIAGQLASWAARLGPWLPLDKVQAAGAFVAEAEATGSADAVEIRRLQLAAEPLIVKSPWIAVNEPRLDASVVGSWNQAKRRLQLNPASLSCATLAVQTNNFVMAVPQTGDMELSGAVSYQGDVARLCRWFADPASKQPSAWQIAGPLRGDAQFRKADGVIQGETTALIETLAVVDQKGQQFQEPGVRLAARGNYTPKTKTLQLDRVEVASSALSAAAAGRMAPVADVNNAQLDGQVKYDLERIGLLARPWIGSNLFLAGQGSATVAFRGPLAMETGQADAQVKWDRLGLYGLQVGPGQVRATLANGVAQLQPLDLNVGQGRVHIAPRVRVAPGPREFSLPSGRLAERVEINPTMCASMLKYAAPVLAGVTSAKGTFSLDLDACRIPLDDPAKGELAGRFTIHSVEIGPGPVIREMATILGRETPARLQQESIVPFRMQNGRVYHENLVLLFPDFTIRTSGSVGLDETLQITAEMPVPPKWIQNNPAVAQSLRNEIIRIPIAGTLTKPQLDARVMEQYSRRFLQKAAQNVIEGELNKQFDRLFKPK